MDAKLTSELVVAVATLIISAGLTWIPNLREKYAALSSEAKSAIIAGLEVLVVAFVVLSSCLQWWIWIECSKPGILKVIELLIVALLSGAGGYVAIPQPQSVKEIKAARLKG